MQHRWKWPSVDFSELKGKVLASIKGAVGGSDQIFFITESGECFAMYHVQDCCESVHVQDITGDIEDLLGSEILLAEEVSSTEVPDELPELKAQREKEKKDFEAKHGLQYYEGPSETWTFYKLSTIQGSVTIRWYGTSNGYYSERVHFKRVSEVIHV